MNRQDDLFSSILQTPSIAHYCSGTDWGFAAARALHGADDAIIFNEDKSWLLLTQNNHSEVGCILHPLEATWGFSSPVIGPDPARAVALLSRGLSSLDFDWSAACLSGLSETLLRHITDALKTNYRVVCHPGIHFHRAHIGDGVDAFLSRRSARFRRNMLRARRIVQDTGISFSFCKPTSTEVPSVWDRIQRVEASSWKWANEDSVLQNPQYHAFYGALMFEASERGGLHVGFARQGDSDVAYVVGGVLGMEYRGFQMSFDDRFRSLGLGNAMQMAMIERLSQQHVQTYDLGMHMEYKERWSDEEIQLHTAFLFRS